MSMIRDLTESEIAEFKLHFPEHQTPDCLILSEFAWWYGVKDANATDNHGERHTAAWLAENPWTVDGAEYIKRGGGWSITIEYEEWKLWPSHWFEVYRRYGSSFINLRGEVVKRDRR